MRERGTSVGADLNGRTPSGMLAVVLAVQMGCVTMVARGSDAMEPLAGTPKLTIEGDLAARMVAGIDRYLMKAIKASQAKRSGFWKPDYASHDAYTESVAPNRERFRQIIGAVDPRVAPPAMELRATVARPSLIARTDTYHVHAVRWPALDGLHGEGLLLRPEGKPTARIVALPDADQTPEMLVGLADGVPPASQFARRLAEAGCEVLVPVVLSRADTFSGNPRVAITNQPHREFVYRMAYEMGRHVIGYEVQKVLAAVDGFASHKPDGAAPIGLVGYGEGGLIALYATACDPRIDAAAVSGYVMPRERVWSEPIYRNVWRLLREFGDAEIVRLIAPRPLIVEACEHPEIDGPPKPRKGHIGGAAPGKITTPSLEVVRAEVRRAREAYAGLNVAHRLTLTVSGNAGQGPPGCDATLKALLAALGRKDAAKRLKPPNAAPQPVRDLPDARQRTRRQFDQMVDFTQKLVRHSEFVRDAYWSKVDASSLARFVRSCEPYRTALWEDVIGRLPDPTLPANPRTRQVYDRPQWRGYEVVLDVWPDVFACGILLLPKDLKAGERRPVVVCQHGLEGTPRSTIERQHARAYTMYAAKLADRGFVVYAPQNPYIGKDDFRVLQRKANPLGLSLFSFIIGQHDQTLRWLATLPCVDADRIGFYGISYGGKTAVRVPTILTRYALSICSADFNEWIYKNTTVDHRTSYMYTGEYEMPEFNLGHTFNYAEMANLMVPRPFMVERGHWDGVAKDEWVAYEYAKVRRRYDRLGIGDRTEIEWFNGPHKIHGVATFEFLHEHLKWPK